MLSETLPGGPSEEKAQTPEEGFLNTFWGWS